MCAREYSVCVAVRQLVQLTQQAHLTLAGLHEHERADGMMIFKVNPINSVMVGAERREEAEQQRALLGMVANALSLCTMHA